MNSHNEELERVVDELTRILNDADEATSVEKADWEANRRLAASFLEYTYSLGKIDGATMMAKVGVQ
jgi:hypothetical protein